MVRTSLQPSENIKKNIFDRFYWDSRIDDFANINVEISEGNVILSGSVPNYPSRRHAEMAASAVPGVKTVENKLSVKYNHTVKIPSDLEIENRVRSVVHWNSNINEEKIGIFVTGGYTTLEGSVSSFYQKFRAQELAADVIGVLGIDNRLVVVPGESYADEEIAGNVVSALKSRLGADADSLTVMAKGGIVTLTGSVPDMIAFQGVENVVRHVRGIVDLHNLLTTSRNPEEPL